MEIFSRLLSSASRPCYSSRIASLVIWLMLALDTGQNFLRELQSTISTPEIAVKRTSELEYIFSVQNYSGVLNGEDDNAKINLKPGFGTWASYGSERADIALYLITNYTGYSKLSARFSEGCLFPVLASSINSRDYPYLNVDKRASFFNIGNTYLGFPGTSNVTLGEYRTFKNFISPNSADKANLREQTLDFTNLLSYSEFGASVYCAYFASGVRRFEFELSVQKRQTSYEANISDKFESSGRKTETRVIPYKSEYLLKASNVDGSAILTFNITAPDNVTVYVEYHAMGLKKSLSNSGNVFAIPQCENLVVTIVNVDSYREQPVGITYTFTANSSENLTPGQIAGIVVGSVAFLVVVAIILICNRRKFACCRKKESEKQPSRVSRRRDVPAGMSVNAVASGPVDLLAVMTVNNSRIITEVNEKGGAFQDNEYDDLVNKSQLPRSNNVSFYPDMPPQTNTVIDPNMFPILSPDHGHQKTQNIQPDTNNQSEPVKSVPEIDIPIIRLKVRTDGPNDRSERNKDYSQNRSGMIGEDYQGLNDKSSNLGKRNH
jgi:hypothetical protein